MPNVQDEPRPGLARLVLLGARGVTVPVVGSGALLGVWVLRLRMEEANHIAERFSGLELSTNLKSVERNRRSRE